MHLDKIILKKILEMSTILCTRYIFFSFLNNNIDIVIHIKNIRNKIILFLLRLQYIELLNTLS